MVVSEKAKNHLAVLERSRRKTDICCLPRRGEEAAASLAQANWPYVLWRGRGCLGGWHWRRRQTITFPQNGSKIGRRGASSG